MALKVQREDLVQMEILVQVVQLVKRASLVFQVCLDTQADRVQRIPRICRSQW